MTFSVPLDTKSVTCPICHKRVSGSSAYKASKTTPAVVWSFAYHLAVKHQIGNSCCGLDFKTRKEVGLHWLERGNDPAHITMHVLRNL